jgi:hypothetical protein
MNEAKRKAINMIVVVLTSLVVQYETPAITGAMTIVMVSCVLPFGIILFFFMIRKNGRDVTSIRKEVYLSIHFDGTI